MITRIFVSLLVVIAAEKSLQAQELFRMNNVPVFHGSKQLINPFTGGMNSCMVNQMDLNNDTIQDLVVVHQYGTRAGRIQTFIQKPSGTYVYEPRYEAFFPKKNSYPFTLKDLNEDKIEDLIIQTESYFLIHYGKKTNDTVFQFDFYDSVEYTSYDPLFGRQQLIALNKYAPVFEDLDSDGDIDIVYVNRSNQRWYYKNYKKELGLPANENVWRSDNKFYGQFCFLDFNPLKIKEGCEAKMAKGETPPHKDPILKPRHDEFQMFWNIDVDGDKLFDVVAYSENQRNAPLGVNIGTKDSAYIRHTDTYFPSYSARPIKTMMPIGFWYDVNNDKVNDILTSFLIERDNSGVQIAQKLFNDDIKTIHHYRNVGKRKVLDPVSYTYHDSFQFISDDFLANETIDVGTGSAPVFYNYDRDSLIDLLIPNIMKRDSWEIGYITYYRNIGNKKQPIYKLESDDLFQYKSKNRANIKLAVGDLNGDKQDDLLVTSFDRNLSGPFATQAYIPIMAEMYFIKVGAGGQFLYTTENLSLEYEEKYGRSNICIHDVDKDGKSDIFVGDLYNLKYYRNISSDSLPKFSKPSCDSVINPLSLVHPDYIPFSFQYHPAVWTDPKDGKDYILFAYQNIVGKVGKALIDTQKLNNNQSLIIKEEHKDLYPNYSINQYPTLALKDVTDDGKAEIIFGNYAGGVQMFSIDSLTGIKDPPPPPSSIVVASENLNFSIYPNPSSDFINMAGLDENKDYSLHIFSMDGRLILQNEKLNKLNTIDISSLSTGIYWIKISRNMEIGKTIIFQKK